MVKPNQRQQEVRQEQPDESCVLFNATYESKVVRRDQSGKEEKNAGGGRLNRFL